MRWRGYERNSDREWMRGRKRESWIIINIRDHHCTADFSLRCSFHWLLLPVLMVRGGEMSFISCYNRTGDRGENKMRKNIFFSECTLPLDPSTGGNLARGSINERRRRDSEERVKKELKNKKLDSRDAKCIWISLSLSLSWKREQKDPLIHRFVF